VETHHDFATAVEKLLDEHINRKRYSLNLWLQNGQLHTVSIKDGSSPSEVDFRHPELNEAYTSFQNSFEKLQDTFSDLIGNTDLEHLEILSSHLEEISEKIEEIETDCA